MSGAKQFMPVALACLLISTGSSAFAGQAGGGSILDASNYITPKGENKFAKDAAAPGETTVSVPSNDGHFKDADIWTKSPPKEAPAKPLTISMPKESKKSFPLPRLGLKRKKDSAVPNVPGLQDPEEVISSRHDKQPKGTSKSALDTEAKGGGLFGKTSDAMANSMKSSGGFFMKGFRGIGHTFKNGTEAVTSKIPGMGANDDANKPEKTVKLSKSPNLPKIKPIFGQTSGNEDWKPTQAAQVDNQPAVNAANAPNRVQKSGDGFFKMPRIPFVGRNKPQIAGTSGNFVPTAKPYKGVLQ